MVMLNNSCIFLTGNPTKFSLQFFEFSTIFYGLYKNQHNIIYYLRNYFTPRSLESFPDSQVYPCFAVQTLKRSRPLKLGPQGAAAGGDAGIRRTLAGVRPGKRLWRTTCSQGFEWWPEMGRGRCRRARTAEPSGGGRCGFKSGEGEARLERRASRGGQVGPRGGDMVASRRWVQVERGARRRLHSRRHGGAQGALREASTCGRARGEARRLL
jgi:hypothetical protein